MKQPNFIKQFIERKKQKREMKKQTALLNMLASFDKAESAVLIFFDEVNKRVLLSDILTGAFILNDAVSQRFFYNLQIWLQWKLQQKYWNKKYVDAEVTAVKEFKQKKPNMSPADLKMIREQARLSVEFDDTEIDVVDEYEVCICSGILQSSAQAEAIGLWKNNKLILTALNVQS